MAEDWRAAALRLLDEINRLCEQERYSEALKALEPYLESSPDDDRVWFSFAYLVQKSEQPGVAYRILKELAEKHPDNPYIWNNLAKALTDLRRNDEASECSQKALAIMPDHLPFLIQESTNRVQASDPAKAIEYADKVLAQDPANGQAHTNKGFALLSQYQWAQGWEEYEWGLGHISYRDERNYTGEPRWEGEPVDRLVIYGEQGLGEQIAFAQAVKEAKKKAKHITLDVGSKLVGLMRRSLGVEVWGHLGKKKLDIDFPEPYDAGVSLGSLQKLYKARREDFTGAPYLTPCPVRSEQWRAVLPKGINVGIAWTGGSHPTFAAERSTTLRDLSSLLGAPVNWIGLEYKDRGQEIAHFHEQTGIKIHDYGWATRSNDLDDLAALISQLDLVISVPQTAVHVAGGLGVPCWCIVNPRPHFMMGIEGDTSPWYSSVRYFRRGKSWEPTVLRVRSALEEFIRENRCNHPGRPGARAALQACG